MQKSQNEADILNEPLAVWAVHASIPESFFKSREWAEGDNLVYLVGATRQVGATNGLSLLFQGKMASRRNCTVSSGFYSLKQAA